MLVFHSVSDTFGAVSERSGVAKLVADPFLYNVTLTVMLLAGVVVPVITLLTYMLLNVHATGIVIAWRL